MSLVEPGTKVKVGLDGNSGRESVIMDIKYPGIILAQINGLGGTYYNVSWWVHGAKHEGNLMREEFEIMEAQNGNASD